MLCMDNSIIIYYNKSIEERSGQMFDVIFKEVEFNKYQMTKNANELVDDEICDFVQVNDQLLAGRKVLVVLKDGSHVKMG